MKKISPKIITYTYLFSIGILSLLSISSYYILYEISSINKNSALIINISGRQRMLLQLTAALAEQLVNEKGGENQDIVRKELLDAVNLMITSHYGLTRGYPDERLDDRTSPNILSIYFSKPTMLDQQFWSYIKEIKTLINSKRIDLTPSNPHIKIIRKSANSKLLEPFDEVVKRYQKESEKDITFLQEIQIFVLGTNLFSLFILGLFVFRPMVRRIDEELIRLENAENRIRTIVDNIGDALIVFSKNLTIESFNPGAEKIFGYSFREISEKKFTLLAPALVKKDFLTRIDKHIDKDKDIFSGYKETIGVRKDRSRFSLEFFIKKITIDNRYLYICVARDITERKNIEKMQNEFISTMNHELRTPLTSIHGSLGLIACRQTEQNPSQLRRLIDIAYKNSHSLINLINDILDMEKVGAGKMSFKIQCLKLIPLVEQAIEANYNFGEIYKVKFILKDDIGDIKVNVDAERLLQVFSNLLSNAAKFSPPNNIVLISINRESNRVRVSIKDNGEGIPDEFHNRIFQKFAQADSRKGGSGLGLNISKMIIEKFGGEIGFETAQDKGTTFYFYLPEAGSRTLQ